MSHAGTDDAARIRRFIIQNFLFDDATALPDDTCSLLEQGIIDSTGVLDLIMFMEEEFGISIADDEVTPEHFDSVSRLAAFASAKQAVVPTVVPATVG